MARVTFTPETPEARWRREDLQCPIGFTALYRMLDRDGTVLYIGITRNPIERWRTHSQRKDWWCAVDRIEVEYFSLEYDALAAEVAAIRAESPLYNLRSAVR